MHNSLQELSIFLSTDIATSLKEVLGRKKYSKFAVIVDENTLEHCYPMVQSLLPEHILIQVQSGEENKNLSTCTHIWEELTQAAFDRKSLVINLGGGVIGDMGGFCASTYKRGIEFIQIPTTLLSQVDASVGGKLGVDFHTFKNHIGVFNIPQAVLINSEFQKTLPKEELRSGFAEIIKHCLIADAAKWEVLKQKGLEAQDWDDLIEHSVLIKAKITDADPTEQGLRKILNFGHTVGHAIESYFLEIPGKKLLHGEAIAVGMVCEAYLSYTKGYISKSESDTIKAYLLSVYGHNPIAEQDIAALIPLTIQDKKNVNNVVLASLLAKVGEANWDIELTAEDIRSSIQYYNA